MNLSLPLPRFDVPRAGKALAALLRDPDDLPQVFTLIDSMSGTAPARLLLGFRLSDSGKKLLRERPNIVKYTGDRAWLRAQAPGTVARAYLAFVESEGISAEGIMDASKTERSFASEEMEWLRCRMRDTHDLWHAVTGYKGDVLGELSLLAFGWGSTGTARSGSSCSAVCSRASGAGTRSSCSRATGAAETRSGCLRWTGSRCSRYPSSRCARGSRSGRCRSTRR